MFYKLSAYDILPSSLFCISIVLFIKLENVVDCIYLLVTTCDIGVYATAGLLVKS